MKRARHRLQRVVGIGELVCCRDAAEAVGGRQEEPVVGADVRPALRVPYRESAPAASHAGVDDGEMDSRRHVRERVGEHERSLQHMSRPDSVRDVDYASVGRDRRDHAVTCPDEIVLEPEVGQERDDHGWERTASTSPSRS